ncbi:MAG: C39 family peptidase [Candidatus Brennerbacteria bacterium]
MRFNVPAYSQYLDVKNRAWKRRSCGIVALKMVLDFLKPKHTVTRTFPRLIKARIRAHAYIRNVGWSHAGLARVAMRYGFKGKKYNWSSKTPKSASITMLRALKRGPVIASIYRNLKYGSSGHLVVVTGFEKNIVFYNDPDSKTRHAIPRKVPLTKFLKGWKQRIIVVRI